MAKLKNKIELSKSTGLGTKHMLDITYEVNYSESTQQATLIKDSIQIHDHVTQRIIRDHDILQSEFLTTLCREDAKTVQWFEVMTALRCEQQRMLDNATRNIIPIAEISYGDSMMRENDRLCEKVNQYHESQTIHQ